MKNCVSCIDAGLGLFLSPLLSTINKKTHFQISKGCLDSSSKSSRKSNLSSPQPTFSGFMCAAGITALLKKMDYRWCLTYDDLDVGEGHFDFFTKKNKLRIPKIEIVTVATVFISSIFLVCNSTLLILFIKNLFPIIKSVAGSHITLGQTIWST